MRKPDFWDKRVAQYGHTGWADPCVYAYDQNARMMAVKNILNEISWPEHAVALDFGCGTGDFSVVLSDFFEKVFSYDISERVIEIAKRKSEACNNIEFHNENLADAIADESLNLVLSITVLGHILVSSELKNTLDLLNKKMKYGGYFIALEFNKTNEMKENNYQKYRSFVEWKTFFKSSNFELVRDYGYFHPTYATIHSYNDYNKNVFVKVYDLLKLRLIFRRGFFLSYFNNSALKFLKNKTDFYWNGLDSDIMKFMIYKKVNHD